MAIKNQEALNERANNLEAQGLNGFKLVLVTLHPDQNPTEAHLEVHFYNNNEIANILNDFSSDPAVAKQIFPISGGHRILGGPLADQIQAVNIVPDPVDDTVFHLTLKPIGDYSTYTLSIVYQNTDPIFSEIEFKFRPGCFKNCPPDWETPPGPKEDPAIDYLAKDYDSFRHTMIAAMIKRVPDWHSTSEADLDQVLIALFSASADELSDYQDRVMNEAYLGTSRKRVSLARHARLMDYHIHQGNQASTWLALKMADEEVFNLPKDFEVWTGGDTKDSSSIVFLSREDRYLLFSINLNFQNDLNGNIFSNDLREEFEKNDLTFSPNISVTVKEVSKKWVISDDDNKERFFVRREKRQLNIYAPHLHHLLNDMSLYTWRDSIPALKAGSTEADLSITKNGDEQPAKIVEGLIRDGKVEYLLVQEHKNPLTGEVRGRDPTKRQLLKLIPGDKGDKVAKAKQDPLTGDWFVQVHWEEKDKLKSNYCFTVDCPEPVVDVSLFHGNLVQVYHGRPKKVIFRKEGSLLASSSTPTDPKELHYRRTKKGEAICKLPDGPLAYKDTNPGGKVWPKSTLEVEVEVDDVKDPWDEVISLIHSDDSDERGDHFVVETDEEGRSLIRFGNGINGRKLPEKVVVHCTYQIARGLDGNIGADTLQNFDDENAFSEILSCWNPFDVTNGRAPEPVAEIIRRAPEAYRFRQLRAVTLKDYKDRAEELDKVSRAVARYMWTGSWRTVRVTIDPVGTTTLTEEVQEKVARHLDAVRLIGEDLEIRPPRFVPLDIVVSLCIHADWWPEDIKYILEQEFSDGFTPDGRMAFFHPDQWTFGQPLRASQIIGRVQSVKGVDHVIGVTLKRWSEVTPGTEGIIEVRPNEIIQVKNDPDHMEQGFITFDVKGGRQ